jgi:response regulator of citrate/malate metabolism
MPSKDVLLPKFTAGEVAENFRISKRTLRRYL